LLNIKRLFVFSNTEYYPYSKINSLTNIIGISGWSGSGKTQLMSKLIKFFVEGCNLKVCAFKHAHSSFEIDKKGKDSYRFFEAGASSVVISSSKQWAVINKVESKEPSLNDLLSEIKSNFDLILVEGWKFENIKKIEVFRKKINKPLLCNNHSNFIAVATNSKNLEIKKVKNISILNLNNINEVGNFILKHFKIKLCTNSAK